MATSTGKNARWWEEPKDNVHTTLATVFRTVRDECEWRIDAHEYHAGLYCASDRPGVRGLSRRGYEYGPATLPYNLCRSAVQSLTAKIGKHRPLPQVLTQRGNWKNQKRARKFTQFLEGEFYRQHIFEEHSADIIRDALIFGTGALKVFTEGDEIRTERTHPWELFADEWDARYRRPRNLYQVRSVDRGVLVELFARTDGGGMRKTLKDAIDSAGRFALHDLQYDEANITVDRVDVVEAWHLPSGKRAKDGRHVIIVDGATLVDETWEHDFFPFAFLTYDTALASFFGHGLVEQLEGYQYEINRSSEKSSEQYHLSGVHVVVPDSAKVTDQQIRNGVHILRHAPGGVPQVFQMDLVNEHMRQRPRELTQDGLNDAGLSQMSVQSQKPAGITAAIALQTLDDIETERFMIFGRAYETWCLDIARRLIECAKTIAEEYGDLAVSVPMKNGLLPLSWTDVYVDGVEIRIFPTSLLPQQLGARLEKLKDMWNTGLIDRATFLRQLDAPDLQAELDLETADKLVIDELLDSMLYADEEQGEDAYRPPSAYQDLAWGARRAQQKYNRALLDGADEFNLELLRRYMKDSDGLMQKAVPPAPMGVPGAGMPAGAPPAPNAVPPELPDMGIPGGSPPMAA